MSFHVRCDALLGIALILAGAACSSGSDDAATTIFPSGAEDQETVGENTTDPSEPTGTGLTYRIVPPTPIPTTTAPTTTIAATTTTLDAATAVRSSFQIDVWADNWMAVYVDGELIGEDSVPITTERSFNTETFTFEAAYPFTLAIEAKDFKETDSGIEYIGQGNQQMGDGGIIAQVTDLATGAVVDATSSDWAALVIHRAPLNSECERDTDPDATCQFESTTAPTGWADADFADGDWASATEWSAEAVSPKDGYDEIAWDSSARLVWGTDLEVDNTVLLRTTVSN